MKQQLRKFHFTLVEVLIAMGICVVGVVSVMGLFPVGANAARDASMNFYADQAAEQMLNLTRYAVLIDKTKDEENENNRFVIFKTLTGWSDIDNPGSAQDKPGNDEPSDWSSESNFGDASASSSLVSNLEQSYTTMLANSGTEIKCHSLQLYRLGFITKAGGNEIEDFACIVRLWATPVYANELDHGSLKLPRIATFHVEVSWPADLAYDRRQKAEYSLDVFVPAG